MLVLLQYKHTYCTMCCVFQWRPSKQPFISEVKKAIGLLRDAFRKTIEDRIYAMNTGKDLPNDALQYLLRGLGKYYILIIYPAYLFGKLV